MKIKTLLVSMLLAATPALTMAASASEQLRSFVQDVRAAKGEFSQRTVDSNGQSKGAPQSGQFVFQRPGQFKWHVQRPYEQLIVSDGKVLYQYDPDLAQVTERGVDQSIGASPAAILFGTGNLEESFRLAEQDARDGLEWIRATPLQSDAGFSYVDIGFKGREPRRLELQDSFGQTTYIDFTNLDPNPRITLGTFTFKAPAGVDVVSMP
ncbi:outer membrane lipoprotein chaperone LolA [Alcaligenes faecalis]|uniref:outer membrane lipoprotein chaperone LolA n=1 Tax=Alcaligenes faecalis TaxID=511 RepID=UPI00052D06EC|nr:outer membrane lipoprotein chaperone LolA [Alcaligenes faecalis]KGP01097.1 membrane protein [Alcaligenes faecalis]MBX6963190.1 outer membrane lipoprotein chaperone LolA [Providencia rettgeri]MBX7029840.1 outer membrane lipoprotein chaperone LolA [Alcaligenes faecalis]